MKNENAKKDTKSMHASENIVPIVPSLDSKVATKEFIEKEPLTEVQKRALEEALTIPQ